MGYGVGTSAELNTLLVQHCAGTSAGLWLALVQPEVHNNLLSPTGDITSDHEIQLRF